MNNEEKGNHLKLVGVNNEMSALPLPKIEDEAVALLVACNSVLNGLALQGAGIPPRLLHDLRLYCREQTGFEVPFQTLASKMVDCGKDESPIAKLQHVGHAISDKAKDVAMLTHNLGVKSDMGHIPNTTEVLGKLGELELALERLYLFFGWSKMIVRMAARNKLDADGARIEK